MQRVHEAATLKLDAVDLTIQEARAWIAQLPIEGSSVVTVLWPFNGLAARMPYRLFWEHFDSLWFPSSDDVVVINDRDQVRDVLVVDHEEQFRFVSIPTLAA